jgi:small-conductance mechanosensitive channel
MMMWLRAETDEEALVDALSTDGVDGWTWAAAGITMLVAFIVSRALKYAIERTLRKRMDAALALLLARLVGYVVIAVGLVYSLEALGVRVGPVLGALGIAGIALAFAFQDILENFVAGILLQLKRPFTFGDQVLINDHEGTVRNVDSRLVTIDTPDGETIMIPTATVIKADINNYTAGGERRTTVPVGVAYGTELRRARTVLEDAVRRAEGVLERPEPEVLFEGFGASSIDFVVRFWHDPSIASFWSTRSEVGFEIDAALADAGITIPFPQRTLHWAGHADE